MNPRCPKKTNEINFIVDSFAKQLQDYSLLQRYTCELKTMLTDGYTEDSLKKLIKERGLLIDKLTESRKHFDLFKEFSDITDNVKWKSEANDLLQKIRQLLDTTVSLDADNIALTKECIKDITLNLEKIKEGKYFVSTLGKHIDNTPSFINICG